jgi:hypothetical protein
MGSEKFCFYREEPECLQATTSLQRAHSLGSASCGYGFIRSFGDKLSTSEIRNALHPKKRVRAGQRRNGGGFGRWLAGILPEGAGEIRGLLQLIRGGSTLPVYMFSYDSTRRNSGGAFKVPAGSRGREGSRG